jgi:hypothetical protein
MTRTPIALGVLTLIFAAIAVLIWLRYFTGAFTARKQPSFFERWLANEGRDFAMPSKTNNLKNLVLRKCSRKLGHTGQTIALPATPITFAQGDRRTDALAGLGAASWQAAS